MNEIAWNGKPIGTKGVYVNLPLLDYHNQLTVGPSVSSTILRTCWEKSPSHAFAQSYLNLHRKPVERSHFSLGRCAHKLLLEGPSGFSNEFAVRPAEFSDFRSNAAKAWRDAQILLGMTIVSSDDLEAVRGMAGSLAAHPMVKAGILDGLVERSLVFQDAETGLWIKARPDVIPLGGGDLSDLKTTVSVSSDDLSRSIASFGYHCQGALCADALKAVCDIEMTSFTLVFVEKQEPYSVRVVTIPEEDIERGRHQNRWAMREFAKAIETGVWPGPGGIAGDAEFIGLPVWARTQIDNRLNVLIPEQNAEISASRFLNDVNDDQPNAITTDLGDTK